MSELAPSPNRDNGEKEKRKVILRGQRGRFVPGTCGGSGNPHNLHTAMVRRAFRNAVTPTDIVEIVETLKLRAKKGNILAAVELLRRAGISVTVTMPAVTNPTKATPKPEPRPEPKAPEQPPAVVAHDSRRQLQKLFLTRRVTS